LISRGENGFRASAYWQRSPQHLVPSAKRLPALQRCAFGKSKETAPASGEDTGAAGVRAVGRLPQIQKPCRLPSLPEYPLLKFPSRRCRTALDLIDPQSDLLPGLTSPRTGFLYSPFTRCPYSPDCATSPGRGPSGMSRDTMGRQVRVLPRSVFSRRTGYHLTRCRCGGFHTNRNP
jgi:hypothetical protein